MEDTRAGLGGLPIAAGDVLLQKYRDGEDRLNIRAGARARRTGRARGRDRALPDEGRGQSLPVRHGARHGPYGSSPAPDDILAPSLRIGVSPSSTSTPPVPPPSQQPITEPSLLRTTPPPFAPPAPRFPAALGALVLGLGVFVATRRVLPVVGPGGVRSLAAPASNVDAGTNAP